MLMAKQEIKYTRFEKAAIIGARALQLSYGAPALIEVGNLIDPVLIAMKEYEEKVIPITVKRKGEK